MQSLCPHCKFPIQDTFFFCPNCGHEIKKSPNLISVPKQIVLYLVAFLLPPFGLIPGLKYLMSPESKVKMVGGVMVGLTVISIIITFIIFQSIASQYTELLNGPITEYRKLGL